MPKLRKTLCGINEPVIQILMKQIESQSKNTIATWALNYAEANMLPIYEKAYPQDNRLRLAIAAARDWLTGKIKLPIAKPVILECHAAAREAEGIPAAQAAARAVAQCASSIHSAAHSLSLAFYGTTAVAYDTLGLSKTDKEYNDFAVKIAEDMLAALISVSVENEPNPAKINWNC
jgi:hypothetical protein